jgi:hypothetical protein
MMMRFGRLTDPATRTVSGSRPNWQSIANGNRLPLLAVTLTGSLAEVNRKVTR